jgi:hypothetical protein
VSVLAIELSDAGLRAARNGALLAVDDGETASPGIACVRGGDVETGLAAARRSCLQPLAIDTRFWDQLDTEPVLARRADSPNRAEVACAHLGAIAERAGGADDEVVIAVPSFYGREALGILVAIVRELGLPLKALVASPVALPLDGGGGPVIVVDMTLHRAVATVVETGATHLMTAKRLRPGAGTEACRRLWMKALGAEFVRSTRFDPLHDGDTEQRLHDALPEMLAALATAGSMPMELSTGSHVHRVTVTDRLLADAARSVVFAVCDDIQELLSKSNATTIVVGHDAARVPGLAAVIRQRFAVTVRVLDPGAAALGLLRAWPDAFEPAGAPGVAHHVARRGVDRPAGAA